jgi:hypothetical protein
MKTFIQNSKKDLKHFQELRKDLERLLVNIDHEELPVALSVNVANEYDKHIAKVIHLLNMCEESLELHVDDLEREEK